MLSWAEIFYFRSASFLSKLVAASLILRIKHAMGRSIPSTGEYYSCLLTARKLGYASARLSPDPTQTLPLPTPSYRVTLTFFLADVRHGL